MMGGNTSDIKGKQLTSNASGCDVKQQNKMGTS